MDNPNDDRLLIWLVFIFAMAALVGIISCSIIVWK